MCSEVVIKYEEFAYVAVIYFLNTEIHTEIKRKTFTTKHISWHKMRKMQEHTPIMSWNDIVERNEETESLFNLSDILPACLRLFTAQIRIVCLVMACYHV